MGGIIFKNAGDNKAGETVSTVVMTTLINSLNVGLLASKANLMRKTLKGEEIHPSEKLKQIRATNFVVSLTMIATSLNRYYLSNSKRIKPAAVLAGIPLGTVHELSMALSDRILKYRSTGGVFLAHQDGGNESLRIVCKAWGIGRYLFLTMLDFIFLYGSAKMLDLFKGSPWGDDLYFEEGPLIDKKDLDVQKRNPWKKFDTFNKDEGREEYHSTFPIVTKNRIFSSMYLETYDIVESVNTGMNMLTVTLFLRKYRPPYPLQFTRVKADSNRKNSSRTAWYRQSKNKDESIYTKISLRWSDSIIDFGLSALIGAQKFLMMTELGFYTVEEMWALTFATHLDKSKGLDSGTNSGIMKDNNDNLIISNQVEQAMGVMM